MSRNSIRSGYYFRGRKISRNENVGLLHAKNWCYTVLGIPKCQYWAGAQYLKIVAQHRPHSLIFFKFCDMLIVFLKFISSSVLLELFSL